MMSSFKNKSDIGKKEKVLKQNEKERKRAKGDDELNSPLIIGLITDTVLDVLTYTRYASYHIVVL